MQFQNMKKKLLKVIIIIITIVFVFNTAFYVFLKYSGFQNIIYAHIQNNENIMDTIGDISSIDYRYFGMKKFSWTGRRTTVIFDSVINASNCRCIMKVTLEKRHNNWIVLKLEYSPIKSERDYPFHGDLNPSGVLLLKVI